MGRAYESWVGPRSFLFLFILGLGQTACRMNSRFAFRVMKMVGGAKRKEKATGAMERWWSSGNGGRLEAVAEKVADASRWWRKKKKNKIYRKEKEGSAVAVQPLMKRWVRGDDGGQAGGDCGGG